MAGSIQNQVKLPLHVAFGVVLQGIRIRFGRSLVTIMGVMLGIAFLMSILTGQAIKRGVKAEADLRTEVNRMFSFLTAEIGPVKGRSIGLAESGALTDREQRFIELLKKEGAQVATPTPQSVAVILAGPGPFPAAAGVLCFTRNSALPTGQSAQRNVSLDRELKPDELERIAREETQAKSRTVWVIVISLLVTVIGISNAMLMSVTERFREIGTMKCLGALSAFIRQIFFIESSLVGFVGSIAGSLLGVIVSVLIYATTFGFGLVVGSLDFGPLTLYFLFSIIAGVALAIIAAIYPAAFASRMVPAHALRSNV